MDWSVHYFSKLLHLFYALCVGGLSSSDITFSWLRFPPLPLVQYNETYENYFQELQYFEVLFCCAYFLPSLPGVLCVLSWEANLHIVSETKNRFDWFSGVRTLIFKVPIFQPKIYWLFQSQTTILTLLCAHSHLSTNNTSCFMATGQALSMPRFRCTLNR